MKKTNIISKGLLLASLFACQAPIAAQEKAESKEQKSRIERLYRTFKKDIANVKKCYISREECTPEEISQARWSAARLGGELMAAIGAAIAIKKGARKTKWAFRQWAIEKMLREDPDFISNVEDAFTNSLNDWLTNKTITGYTVEIHTDDNRIISLTSKSPSRNSHKSIKGDFPYVGPIKKIEYEIDFSESGYSRLNAPIVAKIHIERQLLGDLKKEVKEVIKTRKQRAQ